MSSLAVPLLTIAIWMVAMIGEISASLVLGGTLISIGLRYKAVKYNNLIPSRDPLLIIATLPYVALVLYASMFSIIDVKSYLEVATQEQYTVIQNGCSLITAMLLGGAIHLTLQKGGNRIRASATTYWTFNHKLMLLIAWAPIAIATICYFAFFHGRDYIAIHSNVPIIANISLKTIYLSYPATFFIACSDSITEDKRDRIIIFLLTGHVFVFSVLYMLRSPAVFFLLMVFFIVGHKISTRKFFIFTAITPLILSTIALARDPTLIDAGIEQSIIKLIITFGDFVDALRFAQEYVSSNGILWGGGFINSFFGTAEPLANIYAKSINEDYFDFGGGFGFFILADIFANFGGVGGAVFSVIFGYSLSNLASSTFGTMSSYLSSVLFATALGLTRNDFGSTLRGVIYCLLAFLLIKSLARRKTNHENISHCS